MNESFTKNPEKQNSSTPSSSFFHDNSWGNARSTIKKISHNQYHERPHYHTPIWEKSTGFTFQSLNELPQGASLKIAPPLKNQSTLEFGNLSHMDGRNASRLRKGKLNIDGNLDLHGMNQDVAFHSLKNFILFSYKNQRRCLLIITGKGWKNHNKTGILKACLPQWLNHQDIRPYLLAFTRAQDKHGGDGAFYIMLRKNLD